MKIKDKVSRFAWATPMIFTIMTVGLLIVIYYTNKAAIKQQNNVRADSVTKIYNNFKERTQNYAKMIASSKDVQDGVELDMRHYVKRVVEPLFKSLEVDIITIHERDGYVIYRGHDENHFGEEQKDLNYVAGAFQGNTTNAAITSIDGRTSMYTTVPIKSTNVEDRFMGACTVGYALDDKFASRIKDFVGSDIIITSGDTPFASSFPAKMTKETKGIGLLRLKTNQKSFSFAGKSFDLKYVLLGKGQDGKDIGLFIAVDNTRAQRTLLIILLVSTALIAVIFIVVIIQARRFSDNLTGPIIRTARHAEKVADGNLDLPPLAIKREDEIGTLIRAFNTMVVNIKDLIEKDKKRREYLEGEVERLQNVMSAAAQGDLSVNFEVREEDEIGRIGNSLNKMISDVHDMVEQDKSRREYLEEQVGMLLEVMNAASRGDFAARFAPLLDDEIGKVGTALNHMIEDLHDMIQHDKQRRRELEQRVKTLLEGIDIAARGDLTVAFPDSRQDEFGRIGAALNRMLSDLKRKMQQVEELKALDQSQKEDLEKHVSIILEAVARAAKGDLTVRLESGEQGAINALKQHTNDMLKNLMRMMSSVDEGARMVERTCRDINKTAHELERGANAQRDTMEKTTESVDAMAGAIATMAKHAEDVMSLSSKATDEARAGSITSEQAVQGMMLVEETMGVLHEVMLELEAGAEEIEDVVKAIDEISDQTNLLALNASIEAARAGEYGRGFAVVAKEVAVLAQKSVNSTREITIIVRRIQDRVRKAEETAELGRSRVQQASELVNRSVEALQKIVPAIEGVTELIQHTASALDEQKNDSASILGAVKNVKGISEQSALIIEEAVAALGSLFTLANDLKTLVTQFKIA